jgi:large subunit ribosomal protein L7/L12
MSADTVDQVVELLKGMNALQLSDLKKKIETTFDVTAAAPAAVAAAPAAGGAAAPAAEEKTSFKVELIEVGANKINVIKEVRAITGLGLKEAKDLVEKAPSVVKPECSKEEADKIKSQLEAAGAKVKIS